MRHLARTAKTALTALALTAAAGAAVADSAHVSIGTITPDPLVVRSNGQDYTVLAPMPSNAFVVRARMQYDTGGDGGIKYWSAKLVLTRSPRFNRPFTPPGETTANKKYAFGSRPRSIDNNFTFRVDGDTFGRYVVQACNSVATSLQINGMPRSQIHSEDRRAWIRVSLDWDVDANGAGSDSPSVQAGQSATKDVPVICQKAGGAQVPLASNSFAPAVQVVRSELLVKEHAPRTGECYVDLTAIVKLNRPGHTVRLRFVEQRSGKRSEILSGTTASNGVAILTKNRVQVPKRSGPETGTFFAEISQPQTLRSAPVSFNMNCTGIGGLQQFDPSPPTAADSFATPTPPRQRPLATPVDRTPDPSTRPIVPYRSRILRLD